MDKGRLIMKTDIGILFKYFNYLKNKDNVVY